MAGKYVASSHRNCVGCLGMWRETQLHACPQQYIIFFSNWHFLPSSLILLNLLPLVCYRYAQDAHAYG